MDGPLRQLDSQQRALYQRILTFSLDDPGAYLSFSRRLARDNGWSLDYAQSVIKEYKKFTFLAIVTRHPVTPSDQVDQVWHLHLSYTQSYWQEFCPKVLQTQLYHNPTQGGSSEQAKFDDWYSWTLASYQQFFGEVPPIDIWPDAKERFGRDLHFVRVNTQQNWVVPKPSFNHLSSVQLTQRGKRLLLLTVVAIATGCQLGTHPANPLNFRGPEFLAFYLGVALVVLSIAACLRWYLRLPDGSGRTANLSLDAYETAYLAEGKSHAVDTAIAKLVQAGIVAVDRLQKALTVEGSTQAPSHPVERAVLNAIHADGRIYTVRRSVTEAIDAIRDRLRQQDLLVSARQSFKARIYPTLLIASLLGLGIAKIFVGISREKPVGYLTTMCVVIAIISLRCWGMSPHRSRYGDRVLANLRSRTRLSRSTLYDNFDPELPMAFALFGVSVLTGETLGDLRQVIAPVSTSSGGGGDGDGGCGGGGGGCGGCGGCGG